MDCPWLQDRVVSSPQMRGSGLDSRCQVTREELKFLATSPGWARLVQTRLTRKYGLVAALLTAVPFALVHMPLHFIGDFSLASLTSALVTLPIVCTLVRLLLGIVLDTTGGSVLAAALTHTLFNRSNNEEGIIAGSSRATLENWQGSLP